MKKRLNIIVRGCLSPEGRRDIGALLAAAVSIYTALHRAGI